MRGGIASSDNRRLPRCAPRLAALWGLLGSTISLCLSPLGCSTFSPGHDVLHVAGDGVLGDSSHLISQALHQYHKGHLEQAASKFEQALAIEPNHGVAHNNLGLIYYQQRQLVAAANHFDAASALLPDDPRPVNNLGMTLEAGGRVMEAIELYDEANYLAPDNPLYLGNWLRARVRMGEQSDGLIEQLEHLAFIETRADWVSWTDEQLALVRNPALDRGPAGNTNGKSGNLGNRSNAINGNSRQNSVGGNRLPIGEPNSNSGPGEMKLAPSQLWDDSAENLPVPAPAPPE